jgi:hypothetical protein
MGISALLLGTLAEAIESFEAWRKEYNARRSDRSLGKRTPNEFPSEVGTRRRFIGIQTAEMHRAPYLYGAAKYLNRKHIRGSWRLLNVLQKLGVLAMEAHPLVNRRTGVDPVECLRLLSSWRAFTFIAAESGASLDIRTPVLDQLPQEIHNSIAISALPHL